MHRHAPHSATLAVLKLYSDMYRSTACVEQSLHRQQIDFFKEREDRRGSDRVKGREGSQTSLPLCQSFKCCGSEGVNVNVDFSLVFIIIRYVGEQFEEKRRKNDPPPPPPAPLSPCVCVCVCVCVFTSAHALYLRLCVSLFP